MKTIRLLIDLTYDNEYMHGSDPAAEWWFEEDVLGGGSLVLVDRGDMGDDVGNVRIIARMPVDDKNSPTATDDKNSPVAEDLKALDRQDLIDRCRWYRHALYRISLEDEGRGKAIALDALDRHETDRW